MAVLVTGGAGCIGSHMALALSDAGERVVTLDDLSIGFRDAIATQALAREKRLQAMRVREASRYAA